MRIIKFKYRHTEKAHWEGAKKLTKKEKEKIREMVQIRGQMRRDRRGKISSTE